MLHASAWQRATRWAGNDWRQATYRAYLANEVKKSSEGFQSLDSPQLIWIGKIEIYDRCSQPKGKFFHCHFL